MIELRPYQQDSINKLRDSLRSGHRRTVLQLPTGAGKTEIASAIISSLRANQKRVMFTVPTLSLVDQTVEKFAKRGIDAGVIQANHWKTDHSKPVQVASIQTLARRGVPEGIDYIIVDEAHLQFKSFLGWLNDPANKATPAIGLSATPWARGMADTWSDLVIGATTEQLIHDKYLSDFRVFAPAHKPDLSKVKTRMGDYAEDQLSLAMNKSELVADIVETWMRKGPGFGTMCFCVDRLHAKSVQARFIRAGVNAGYVDAFSSLEDRQDVLKQFRNGDIPVICNVGVLTTGVDEDVRCIILARPTKSEILYCQIIGRGLRTHPDKFDGCLILDHSDTTQRLGFVTDINHAELSGSKALVAKATSTPLPKECPQCHFMRPAKVAKCPSCGFVAEAVNKVESRDGHLTEMRRAKKGSGVIDDPIEKENTYRQLIGYAQRQGYKRGWARYSYIDKFGCEPDAWFRNEPIDISPETASWIKSRLIRHAKSKQKWENRI